MRQFGLIGFPLGHSWSKKYFEEKFRKEGLSDYSYSLFPLENINDLPELIRDRPGLKGLNVTIPHKEKVIPLLNSMSGPARAIGAVNTISIHRTDGIISTTGYNTDAYGFEKSLELQGVTEPTAALVLGTGGASKAVCHVLNKLGWAVTLVSRSSAPVSSGGNRRPGSETTGAGGLDCKATLSYGQITPGVILRHRLIVNTTPLGMYPDTATLPDLPYRVLTAQHVLYDLVYNPEMTRFLEMGSNNGCQIIGGLDMLKLQADKAFSIWMETS